MSTTGHWGGLPREKPTPSAGDVWDGAVAPSSLPHRALPRAVPQEEANLIQEEQEELSWDGA